MLGARKEFLSAILGFRLDDNVRGMLHNSIELNGVSTSKFLEADSLLMERLPITEENHPFYNLYLKRNSAGVGYAKLALPDYPLVAENLFKNLAIEVIPRSVSPKDNLINLAYSVASFAHHTQKRANGALYLEHLIGVKEIVHENIDDPVLEAASLLHDTVEDTFLTIEDIYALFGREIGFLVDGMTKPSKESVLQEGHGRYMEKFFMYAEREQRLILLRLSDRLHNMRTLGCFRPEKQKRIARETLRIYVPLAEEKYPLIHDELMELCMQYLH